jgi:hypothetical protein
VRPDPPAAARHLVNDAPELVAALQDRELDDQAACTAALRDDGGLSHGHGQPSIGLQAIGFIIDTDSVLRDTSSGERRPWSQ